MLILLTSVSSARCKQSMSLCASQNAKLLWPSSNGCNYIFFVVLLALCLNVAFLLLFCSFSMAVYLFTSLIVLFVFEWFGISTNRLQFCIHLLFTEYSLDNLSINPEKKDQMHSKQIFMWYSGIMTKDF